MSQTLIQWLHHKVRSFRVLKDEQNKNRVKREEKEEKRNKVRKKESKGKKNTYGNRMNAKKEGVKEEKK